MNDSLGMRGIEGIGNLNRQIEQRFRIHRAAVDAVFQRLPFQELHDDEGLAVFLVNLVDGADVGMVQRRRGARFPLKAIQGLAILGKFFGQKLKRDEAAKFEILGPVNDTHAAAAQLLDDAVMRDGLADQ